MQKLEDGQLDFFGPMQKTKEREEKFIFSQSKLGSEAGALFIRKDRDDIYYNDPSSFNNLDVATIKGSYYEALLRQYCADNNITMNIVYRDVSQLSSGLHNKEYDMVLAANTLDIENSVVVTKMEATPTYLATNKNSPALATELDYAIESIFQQDNYYESNLFNLHYKNKAGNLSAFTLEERNFIEENKTLRVICNSDWLPISYYNSGTNKVEGVGIDLLNAIGEEIGIEFELMASKNHDDALAQSQNNEADLMFGFIRYDHAQLNYTDSIMDTPLVIVGKGDINKKTNHRVGYYRASEVVSQELKHSYPNFSFVQYDSIDALIEALSENKEEYVMFNYYASEEMKWRNPDMNFNIAVSDINFSIDMGASKQSNPLMIDIINKGMKHLSSERISSIIYANSASRSDKYYLQRLLSENRQLLFLAGCGFIFILLLTSTLLTYRKKRALQKMAYYDSLTNIYTIEKFRIDAKAKLAKAKANELALVYLDINNFKYINNSFGYANGDIILKHVVQYLKQFQTHISPKDEYLFGRMSGDHFIVLIEHRNVNQFCQYLQNISEKSVIIDGMLEAYTLYLSIGTYVIEKPNSDLNNLLDKANYARKKGKALHSNKAIAYTSEMNEIVRWEKEVTMNMENALKHEEYIAYFQPKYDFQNEQLIGAEALARWNHPKLGMIPPIKFIPIFEQNGFIKKFDFYILEETCRFLSDCKHQNIPVVPISINLSRIHLQDKKLCEHVTSIVDTYKLDHSLIEIELTENILMEDFASIIGIMQKLRDVGFNISIDDFGSEYSSLRLISELPANTLKIDKAFVDHCLDNTNGKHIIQKIIELAKSISFTTVAEGIETQQQAQLLKTMGCDIAQGYYYSKPLSEADFAALLTQKNEKRA